MARGEEPAPPRTFAALEVAAVGLLSKHRLKRTPATERLAKIHCQATDAVDTLYELCVVNRRETRQVSAMVSAGKLAVATLNMLGLPGDDLEDEEAEANEAEARRVNEGNGKASTEPEEPADDLEAYE